MLSPGLVALPLAIAWVLVAYPPPGAQSCNGWKADLKDGLKPCMQNGVMNPKESKVELTEKCMLKLRVCAGNKEKLDGIDCYYSAHMGIMKAADGKMDVCEVINEKYEAEQKKNKEKNKYEPVKCPWQKGKRCFTQAFNVSKYKENIGVANNAVLKLTCQHGNNKKSCVTGAVKIWK